MQKHVNPVGVVNLARKVTFISCIPSVCLLTVETWGGLEANLIAGLTTELVWEGEKGAQSSALSHAATREL